jgi:hypothetical protein
MPHKPQVFCHAIPTQVGDFQQRLGPGKRIKHLRARSLVMMDTCLAGTPHQAPIKLGTRMFQVVALSSQGLLEAIHRVAV